MHNTSSYCDDHHPQTLLSSLAQVLNPHGHGKALLLWFKDYLGGVMFLFHDLSSSLGFFLLFLHISSLILIKLFTFLYNRSISKGDVEFHTYDHDEYKFEANMAIAAGDVFHEKRDLVADVLGGETLLFLYKESTRDDDDDDSLLVEDHDDKVKDSKEEGDYLEKEDTTLVEESTYCSPLEDLAHDQKLGIEYNHVSIISNLDSKEFTLKEEDKTIEDSVLSKIEEEKDSSEDDEKVVSIKSFHPHNEKLRAEEVHGDIENFGGSLTGESTSKSSVEWRSSTIFRDSETEYPFSSSSRRSSSRWESYTVFPKYNEGMHFLDRISAQKLSETESLRSIQVQPRSISERIVHKLSTNNKTKNHSTMGKRRDPYEELESAYVAQICLAWEALNCNYTNFRQKKYSANGENPECSGCPERIAQEFQQFQVLLQRFIENEPYEYGRRSEVYARRRISSTKLLYVPEFRDSEGEDGEMSSKISSSEFLGILEDAIRTFMNFLKADKEKYGDIIKSFIRKKTPTVDPTFLRFLKKANRRKKMKLKDIGRRHRCIRKRKLSPQEEMEILMGLIDLKVVSRVLRMAGISEEQLHWCEEKMSRVRILGDGKWQRDSSPLFFPVH